MEDQGQQQLADPTINKEGSQRKQQRRKEQQAKVSRFSKHLLLAKCETDEQGTGSYSQTGNLTTTMTAHRMETAVKIKNNKAKHILVVIMINLGLACCYRNRINSLLGTLL